MMWTLLVRPSWVARMTTDHLEHRSWISRPATVHHHQWRGTRKTVATMRKTSRMKWCSLESLVWRRISCLKCQSAIYDGVSRSVLRLVLLWCTAALGTGCILFGVCAPQTICWMRFAFQTTSRPLPSNSAPLLMPTYMHCCGVHASPMGSSRCSGALKYPEMCHPMLSARFCGTLMKKLSTQCYQSLSSRAIALPLRSGTLLEFVCLLFL
mmetsp:Transcript_70198/g.81841  ORF Transcript_70198/g.81841 Transcript_70198/m.81841 type:complete len:210 (-) Transcript_70198:161-790(-)